MGEPILSSFSYPDGFTQNLFNNLVPFTIMKSKTLAFVGIATIAAAVVVALFYSFF